MIKTFSIAPTPLIHFGAGKLSLLPELAEKFGKNILIITGASSFLKTKYWESLQQKFTDRKIQIHHSIIAAEPSPPMVDECVSKFKKEKIALVIAIGGGSVLDGGKAISAMLPLGDSVRNYLEGIGTRKHGGGKIPFIAVPTTSGTGSEATKNAVLSEVGIHGYKKSLRHDQFVPDIALVDPELTLNCPLNITSSSGMDAFTQLLESYLSTNANPMTDSLAEEGLRCIKKSLLLVCKDGSNLEARTDMAYASMISGITLANASLGIVHGYASAIGGYFDIPHGVICGTLMGAANRITVRKLKASPDGDWALKKYAKVGEIFSGAGDKTQNYYINFILDLLDQWTEDLQIPWLSEFAICSDHFDKIIARTENKNNPVSLDKDELREVLELRT